MTANETILLVAVSFIGILAAYKYGWHSGRQHEVKKRCTKQCPCPKQVAQ